MVAGSVAQPLEPARPGVALGAQALGGASRPSSSASAVQGTSAAWNWPVDSSTQARPTGRVAAGGASAARWLDWRGSSRSSSVRVPGVTTRVTSRRTSPLAWAGSSTCRRWRRGGRPAAACAGSVPGRGAESRPWGWSCRGWSGSGRARGRPPRRRRRTARRSRPCGTTAACRDGVPWPPGTAASWGSGHGICEQKLRSGQDGPRQCMRVGNEGRPLLPLRCHRWT